MLDRAVFVHLGFVSKNQLVSVLIVLKEIEDAVLFHQPREKVECSLAVLDDVFTLGVAGLGAVLEILKTVVLENFLNDLGDGLLLKNLAIRGAREEPKPGDNFSTVIAEAIVAAHAGKAVNKAIPMPLFITGVVDLEGHLLADNVLEGNGMIFRKQIRGKMKKLRHAFVTAEALQKKSVLAERGKDGHEALLLDVGHIQN